MSAESEAQQPERYYRVVPVFETLDKGRQLEDASAVVRGELTGVSVVSVPPDMPMPTINALVATLKKRWPDEQFLVLTHNIEFLRAVELTEREAQLVSAQSNEGASKEGGGNGATT